MEISEHILAPYKGPSLLLQHNKGPLLLGPFRKFGGPECILPSVGRKWAFGRIVTSWPKLQSARHDECFIWPIVLFGPFQHARHDDCFVWPIVLFGPFQHARHDECFIWPKYQDCRWPRVSSWPIVQLAGCFCPAGRVFSWSSVQIAESRHSEQLTQLAKNWNCAVGRGAC